MQIKNESFFCKIKEIKELGVQPARLEQLTLKTDAEIVKKGHFWMETS